jgi:hypothetical protein
MANEQSEAQRAAQAAIDEAARTVAEASRRTSEQAQQATRTLMDQTTELNRSLFSAWATNGEALWRAIFELQNTQLRTTLSWWQTMAEGSRATLQVVQQWEGLTRQAQQAWLESFQASARTLASTAEQAAVGAAERSARSSR